MRNNELNDIQVKYSNGVIDITINNENVHHVEIPEEIGGQTVEDVEKIDISNSSNTRYIDSLVLPETATNISDSAFNSLTELKRVYIKSEVDTIFNIFERCEKLEYVRIKQLNYTAGLFAEKPNLKRVDIDNVGCYVGEGEFEKCPELDCSNLIHDKLLVIDSDAFWKCDKLEKVDLPKSFKWMYTSSFCDCTNLKTVRINGNVLISRHMDSNADFLKGSTQAVLSCPFDYPIEYLKRITDKAVKIERDKASKEDTTINIENRTTKAGLIGLQIRPYDLPDTKEGILDTLSIMDEQSFREQFIDSIECELKDLSPLYGGDYLIGKYGLFLKVQVPIGHRAEYLENCNKKIIGDNYEVMYGG